MGTESVNYGREAEFQAAAPIEDYFKRSTSHVERNLRPHPHRLR